MVVEGQRSASAPGGGGGGGGDGGGGGYGRPGGQLQRQGGSEVRFWGRLPCRGKDCGAGGQTKRRFPRNPGPLQGGPFIDWGAGTVRRSGLELKRDARRCWEVVRLGSGGGGR